MATAKDKTWTKSMFSQFSNLENKKPVKRKRCRETPKVAKRSLNSSTQYPDEIIDLESEEENSYGTLAKQDARDYEQTKAIAKENWIEFFAPRCSEQLALHPKKIQELDEWFKHCAFMKLKNPAQLCLLSGPSGSGKTAAVRILAEQHNINIQEWINPVDQEIILNLGDQTGVFARSQIDAFKNFLFKASRYRSLLQANITRRCLLMVEDFPNFILKDPSVLHEILEEYVVYAKSPLIFIVADAKNRDLNISYNVFTDQIKQKFLINHINFNPISATLMQKAIKRFCDLMRSPPHCEHYKPPPSATLDSIVLSAQGDIRNVLINLHFSSLRGAPDLIKIISANEGTKNSKKKKIAGKLKSLGRDESVTMMHALGRVFNPKYTENKRFIHSPEEIAESFSTEPKKFIDLVQANYLAHFRDIDFVVEAANGLSLSDILLNEYRDDTLAQIGLNIGVRSTMVANKNPATGWLPIKGQKRLDLSNVKQLMQKSSLLTEYHHVSQSVYVLDYKTFLKLISNKTT